MEEKNSKHVKTKPNGKSVKNPIEDQGGFLFKSTKEKVIGIKAEPNPE